MNIQFVSDATGKPTAVLVPIKEWERLQKQLPQSASAKQPTVAELSIKEKFKEDFRAAVREMQLMQEGKIPKYPLRQFLW